MRIYPGQKWGAIEVVEVERKYMEVKDGAVTEKGIWMVAALKCQCGKTWDERVADIPVQARIMDCGCGCGKDIPLKRSFKFTEPRVITSLYIELALMGRVKEYAEANGLGIGRAICELAAMGLAAAD